MAWYLYILYFIIIFLFVETITISRDIYIRCILLKEAHLKCLEMGKPLLNISCGDTTYGHVNADIAPRNVPRFALFEPDKPFPYEDKHFGAVYCTHTLEHVPDPDTFQKELHRVADHVYLIVPILDFIAINPNHMRIYVERHGKKSFKNPFYHPFQDNFPPNPFIINYWRKKLLPLLEQKRIEMKREDVLPSLV